MLTFRPFLIAKCTLYSKSVSEPLGQLWLRQACRHATDAAQDSISLMEEMYRNFPECKVCVSFRSKPLEIIFRDFLEVLAFLLI